jgi:hypothetical protein
MGAPCRENPQGYIEFLLIKIYFEQRRMGYILEGIKSSLASICPIVDKDLDDFLKDLDDDFSLNFS